MGTEPLEPSKKNNNKMNSYSNVIKFYAVATQGIFTILVLALVGFLLGRYVIKEDTWAAILAVIGGLIGVVVFIGTLLKLNVGGDHNERKK